MVANSWKSTEVFVPSDFPVLTYVERGEQRLERLMRDALSTPRSPISVSGPSKSGKTALVKKTVGENNLIHIFGSQIGSVNDLWRAILGWMDSPISRSQIAASSNSSTPEGSVGGKFGIPGVAEINLGFKSASSNQQSRSTTVTTGREGLSQVQREISNSDYVVFLDDFHYIPRDIQELIGQQIKSASEVGIRFCIASVPHRADDVVRSNHELRGRTINIDSEYWSIKDIESIGRIGFNYLGMKVSNSVISRLAHEACTSPQIMQSLCLDLCFSLGIYDTRDPSEDIEVSDDVFGETLLKTSTRTSFSSLIKQMHAGPRTRGTERKEFNFSDGSVGDVYRASLLAISANPPSMEFIYSDILARIASFCIEEKPSGGSVTESLKQISNFADISFPKQRIVEWDPDAASGTFAVIDPYFLFYIRSSDILKSLV